MAENTLEQLATLVAQQMQQASTAQNVQPTGLAGGLPAMQPFGVPAGLGAGTMPQPTDVSVPVTVPMPDGRELSVRVHFGPEAAQNLQQLAAACMQLFGPYLQARNPWNRSSRNIWNGSRSSSWGRRW